LRRLSKRIPLFKTGKALGELVNSAGLGRASCEMQELPVMVDRCRAIVGRKAEGSLADLQETQS
jgi:hypothetical protein